MSRLEGVSAGEGLRGFELGYGSAAAMVRLMISLCFAFIYLRLMRVEL